MEKQRLTLCGFCNKPIHIKDFGGVQKGVGLFHSDCYKKHQESINSNIKEINISK